MPNEFLTHLIKGALYAEVSTYIYAGDTSSKSKNIDYWTCPNQNLMDYIVDEVEGFEQNNGIPLDSTERMINILNFIKTLYPNMVIACYHKNSGTDQEDQFGDLSIQYVLAKSRSVDEYEEEAKNYFSPFQNSAKNEYRKLTIFSLKELEKFNVNEPLFSFDNNGEYPLACITEFTKLVVYSGADTAIFTPTGMRNNETLGLCVDISIIKDKELIKIIQSDGMGVFWLMQSFLSRSLSPVKEDEDLTPVELGLVKGLLEKKKQKNISLILDKIINKPIHVEFDMDEFQGLASWDAALDASCEEREHKFTPQSFSLSFNEEEK